MTPATPSTIRRHPQNPILSASDIPFEATLIFNAGVCRPSSGTYANRYVMLFRNDHGIADRQAFADNPNLLFDINLGLAVSEDGVKFEVASEPVWKCPPELDGRPNEALRVYDPRLTECDGQIYVSFAMDTRHGIRSGLATASDDFRRFEILSLSLPDNRNMVLFPERINGKLARYERPFPIYGRGEPEAFDLWYRESPDGEHWGHEHLVLGSNEVPYTNNKIGPAAPPIKTSAGWLSLFHFVERDDDRPLDGWEPRGWRKLYGAGLILTRLDRPWEIIAMSQQPVLMPETSYETQGFRGSVIFPGGLLSDDNGNVKIYYGAADTVVCLAESRVEHLLKLCSPWSTADASKS